MACKKPPFRVWIAMMILWTTALNYCFRSFFPVTLIAMLDRNKTVKLENGTEQIITPPNYGPRYPWTPLEEGQLIGAYFYGYTISSLPGGPIAEYFGPYWTIIVSSVLCGVMTCLSVLAVMDSWVPLFVCRLLVGFFGCSFAKTLSGLLKGVQYPSLQCLMGAWAPPTEKGKFTACLMGNVLGSVITQAIVGYLVSSMGWSWGFYFTGFVTLLFLIGWVLLVSDYPEQNWFCSSEEANYIHETHEGSVKMGKSKPPLFQMFTSIPFLTLVISQFGNLWGLYLLLTVVPKFMSDVLKFDLKNVGFLSSTPSISRLISGFVFGAIADLLIKREIVKKVFVRKGFIIFSHFLPGVVMFLFLAISENVGVAVALLIIVMAFNGACVVTTIVNAQDLAPNYAGTQFGIMNFFGSMPGFIIPALVGEITKNKSELPEWAIIFSITAAIYISTGCLFLFFGSVKLQPWNEKKEAAPPAEGKIPYRICIGFMIFWACATGFILLGHFQMAILAMVDKEYRNSTRKLGSLTQEDFGPRYHWTAVQEGQLISSYYYGLAVMSFPGGILIDLIGPFKTVLASNILSSIVTFISASLAGHNWVPLFACRFINGLCGGLMFPSMVSLIAKWAPPKEKSTFTSCVLGFVFGSLTTPPLASIVIKSMGWKWSFYWSGLAALVFCLAWFFLVSDYPLDNWFCPKEEAAFIYGTMEGEIEKGWKNPPIWKMLKCVPFIVLILGHFGVTSGLVLIVTMLPKFLDEALKFDFNKVGYMTAIPSVGRLIAGFFYGGIEQVLLKKYGVDKKYLRKGFAIVSHILPGTVLSIFLLNFLTEFGEGLSFALLNIATLGASAAVVTTSVNPQDLAPNFAGTQIGIMTFFGASAGFIYPTICSKITADKNDISQWSILFGIMGGVYLITGSMFIIFGSTSLQPWNEKMSGVQEIDPVTK